MQKDPTQFQKVMTEDDRYMSEWQRDLQKTPQSMVELFAKAGIEVVIFKLREFAGAGAWGAGGIHAESSRAASCWSM